MIGLYHHTQSVVHRLPAGLKLLLLAASIVGLTFLREPWQVGTAALVVVGLYALAAIPPRVAFAQLKPLLWFLPFTVGFQWLFNGWRPAVVTFGVLVLAVSLAALMTLTMRVSELLDLCERGLRPFRRFGVDPDRVGLLLALTIRCVPLVTGIAADAWQAKKARGVPGLRNAAVALAAPTVVRALRSADALGDALRARGVDD
jgi:biotin transport system permease protein